ncbi:restriction endonuclease subunit S [Acinetobacter guillouiae]|uniref:restriction endonuclease subunit S n=1 Tax=Acinetobacter guillouiae TaxID=106649 RepID=UPI0028D079C7|nr:restriction endonuclease subunit S [Acinetobacter guillouiae]
MDFKEYPSYKDSGVEWLGEVPEHWEQKPIWSMFTRTKRTNHPNELLLSVYRDYGVIPKNSRDDNHNRASEDLTPYQLVKPNDLVINKMKAWQGSIAISEYQGIVSPAYYIYEPKQTYCSNYIHHLIRSVYFIQSYKNFSKGIRVNQWDLEHDAFTHINLLLPPLLEQQQIVSFLDSETSRIDNLIVKQEKLIEVLKEHRKSVISHAVTKGLNPNVPMKNSDVEWLGEVPEHWEIIQSKFYFSERQEKADINDKQLTASQKYGIIFQEDYMAENGRLMVVIKNPEILKKVRPNDFVISMRSFQGGLELSHLEGSISSAYVMLKPNLEVINVEYFKHLFKTNRYIQALQSTSTLIRDGQALRFNNFSQVKLVLAPLHEQNDIIDYIDEKCRKIDSLIFKQRELIKKLKEYRTSIISHAVTGKIDVRDLVA